MLVVHDIPVARDVWIAIGSQGSEPKSRKSLSANTPRLHKDHSHSRVIPRDNLRAIRQLPEPPKQAKPARDAAQRKRDGILAVVDGRVEEPVLVRVAVRRGRADEAALADLGREVPETLGPTLFEDLPGLVQSSPE